MNPNYVVLINKIALKSKEQYCLAGHSGSDSEAWAALVLQNTLRSCRGEHKKRLKLAEMEKTHHGIDIAEGRKTPRSASAFGLRLRAQFRRSEYLGAQIRTRGNQGTRLSRRDQARTQFASACAHDRVKCSREGGGNSRSRNSIAGSPPQRRSRGS